MKDQILNKDNSIQIDYQDLPSKDNKLKQIEIQMLNLRQQNEILKNSLFEEKEIKEKQKNQIRNSESIIKELNTTNKLFSNLLEELSENQSKQMLKEQEILRDANSILYSEIENLKALSEKQKIKNEILNEQILQLQKEIIKQDFQYSNNFRNTNNSEIEEKLKNLELENSKLKEKLKAKEQLCSNLKESKKIKTKQFNLTKFDDFNTNLDNFSGGYDQSIVEEDLKKTEKEILDPNNFQRKISDDSSLHGKIKLNNGKDSKNSNKSKKTYKTENELKEKERKIEYLLKVLEEKNQLISKFNDQKNENSQNQSIEIKEQLDILQLSNENLLKEIEDKNLKIKNLNSDIFEFKEKLELLNQDYLELQEENKNLKLLEEEIELLQNKNIENEQKIESLNKEINKNKTFLIKKENEVSSLKKEKDRMQQMQNKTFMDNRSLFDSFNNNSLNVSNLNASLTNNNKFEFLNSSLNEIRDLKERLRKDNNTSNLNQSVKSKNMNNFNTSNAALEGDNENNKIGSGYKDIRRAIFEETEYKQVYETELESNKKSKQNNNTLNSMNDSLNINNSIVNYPKENNVHIGNISKLNLENEDKNNESMHDKNRSLIQNKSIDSNVDLIEKFNTNKNQNINLVGRQGLFIELSDSEKENHNLEESPMKNKENKQEYNPPEESKRIETDKKENVNSPKKEELKTNETTKQESKNLFTTTTNLDKNINLVSNKITESDLNTKQIKENNQNETKSIDISITNNPSLVSKSSNNSTSQVKRRIKDNISSNDLINQQEYWEMVRDWICTVEQYQSNSFYFRKIFKAKNDGFTSIDFYNKTQGKFPTLTLVKTNHGKLIGGFTQIPWNKHESNIDFIEDPTNSSFLFSLDLKEKFDLKEGSIAVCHSLNSGPVFGLNDLEIVENADVQENFFSNIGTSFDFYGEKDEFYGGDNYLVEDYEVYQIVPLG